MSAFVHPSFIEQDKNIINVDGAIITALVFVDVLAWIEFLLYDLRHPLGEQDLISQQEGMSPLNVVTRPSNPKAGRYNYFLFAVAVTVLTVAAIFILKRLPLKLDV